MAKRKSKKTQNQKKKIDLVGVLVKVIRVVRLLKRLLKLYDPETLEAIRNMIEQLSTYFFN